MPVFLQIPGLQGESTDAHHLKWIALTAVSFGVNVPAVGGGQGKPQFDALIVSKNLDSTSFQLYSYVLGGKPLDGAVIEVTDTNAQGVTTVVYRLDLTQATIESIATQIESAVARTEILRISCTQLSWSNNGVDSSGNQVTNFKVGWNATLNKVV